MATDIESLKIKSVLLLGIIQDGPEKTTPSCCSSPPLVFLTLSQTAAAEEEAAAAVASRCSLCK